MPSSDPFLHRLYDRLHDTPTQRKFRRIAPMPVGVVFQEWPGMTLADMRREFRLMKQLGFTCLKQCLVLPGTDRRKVMHAALDEGIVPWWYDEGGWEAITPGLLKKLRIAASTPIEDIRRHPRFLAHQQKVMRARIDHGEPPDTGGAAGTEIEQLEVSRDHLLNDALRPHFIAWLKATYRTVARAQTAWTHMGRIDWTAPDRATSWEQLVDRRMQGKGPGGTRFVRDVLRFKADLYLRNLRQRVERWREHDPDAPFRAGGEMGLFLPFAARAVDMEGIADVMADAGSFYPSIHLAWHFEEVDFEVARPVYMMAQLVQDWFKGGWAASWESTGGPQQFSGGKAPFWAPAREKIAGFTVDAGVMTQLMLSYLGAGFKGFGFWCWSSPHGIGEFSVLDRQRRPTDRARQMGRIGQAARHWRDELWAARKQPLVGVYCDFESDAVWAAMGASNRDLFRHVPMQARVGVSRALINHNVPWEHVTGSDLRAGLADRYRVIYLPALLSLPAGLMTLLHGYVKRGGRLVIDMPAAWLDDQGRSLDTGEGSVFEKTFGCMIRDYQYASNVPRSLAGMALTGWVADLGVTHGKVAAHDDRGQPAIVESAVGKGSAVVLGYEAARMCFQPGHAMAEQSLVAAALGGLESPHRCEGAMVYHLAAPAADHYFLINDGPARYVTLDTRQQRHRSRCDAVTREVLPMNEAIALPAYSGRWLRYELAR